VRTGNFVGIGPERASPDLIIGTYCIEHSHILLHDVRDFAPMREHLGLQVLERQAYHLGTRQLCSAQHAEETR
jgi:predicted nucleic acid-binding protein